MLTRPCVLQSAGSKSLQAVFFSFSFKDFIYLFSEREEGREKEKERNIAVKKKH